MKLDEWTNEPKGRNSETDTECVCSTEYLPHRMRKFHRKKFFRFNVTRYRCGIKPVKIQRASSETDSLFSNYIQFLELSAQFQSNRAHSLLTPRNNSDDTWNTCFFRHFPANFFQCIISKRHSKVERERCNQKAGEKNNILSKPRKLFVQRLMLYFLFSLPQDKVNTKMLSWIFKIRSNLAHFVYSNSDTYILKITFRKKEEEISNRNSMRQNKGLKNCV